MTDEQASGENESDPQADLDRILSEAEEKGKEIAGIGRDITEAGQFLADLANATRDVVHIVKIPPNMELLISDWSLANDRADSLLGQFEQIDIGAFSSSTGTAASASSDSFHSPTLFLMIPEEDKPRLREALESFHQISERIADADEARLLFQQPGLNSLCGLKQEFLARMLHRLANLGLQCLQIHDIWVYTDGDRRSYGGHGRLSLQWFADYSGEPTTFFPPRQLCDASAPLLRFDKVDSRFIEGHGEVAGLTETYNLAAMEWEEFEGLIREIFEQEYSAHGGEVKITRASRDRGVDAIAFDPDPIRGGKIVIQAKRYTNTVGVEAVRDLYGTVINEGAAKRILVTPSDYGPDAYEFAKGKPLTLLNGALSSIYWKGTVTRRQ